MPSLQERLFAAGVHVCAAIVVAVPLAAASALLWIGLASAVASHSMPEPGAFAGIALFTFGVCACAATIGGVVGIGCAIAAQELTPAAIRGATDAAIGFLGTLPAVAFGWFAAALLAPFAVPADSGDAFRFLAATTVLAAMVAPTACKLMTGSLQRVPDAARQAAAAAGASRLQTTVLVIVPALRPRIVAAVLAAFVRAIGEATAVQVLFAAIASYGMAPSATIASWIFSSATGAPTGATGAELSLPALALMLIAAAGGLLVSREYRGLQWA